MLNPFHLSALHAKIIRAFDEVDRLSKSVADIKSDMRNLEQRVLALEEKQRIDAALDPQKWDAFIEKTTLATKLAVTEASSRFEGDVRERLASLDLRLKNVERHGGQDHPPMQLAGQ